MPTIVNCLPSDFVDFLTDPGLSINSFYVPIDSYLSANPSFGGNTESQDVISYINKTFLVDPLTKQKISAFTTNISRLMMGQGYPDDFALVMTHIANNIDGIRSDGYLSQKSYINSYSSANDILNNMVDNKVFGMDCIGFVSQYLVFSGVWQAYKEYTPKMYRREFKPIATLDQIGRLSLLIWGDYHIAIVDSVTSYNSDGSVTINVCQSSSGGPQTNVGVVLMLGDPTDKYEGAQKFKIIKVGSPAMPVANNVYVCTNANLAYLGDM